jgi:hypothetical protein
MELRVGGEPAGGRLVLRSVDKTENPVVRSATRFLRQNEVEDLWRHSALSQIDGEVIGAKYFLMSYAGPQAWDHGIMGRL